MGGRTSGNCSFIKGCMEIPAMLNQYAAPLIGECNQDKCDTLERLHFCYTGVPFPEAALYIQGVLLPFVVTFSLTNLFINWSFFGSLATLWPPGTTVYSSTSMEVLPCIT